MSDGIGATGEGARQASLNCSTLKCGHKIPSHPKPPKKSDVHLLEQKGMESAFSKFSGNVKQSVTLFLIKTQGPAECACSVSVSKMINLLNDSY